MHLDDKALNSLRGKDLIYPVKEDYTTLYVYYRGEVLGSITKATMEGTIEDIAERMYEIGTGLDKNVGLLVGFRQLRFKLKESGVTVELVVDTEALKQAQEDYNTIIGRRISKFRADLYEHYGVTENPKADAVYDKAYDRSHHAGFGEVSATFGELVDLIV